LAFLLKGEAVGLKTDYFFRSGQESVYSTDPITDILTHLAYIFVYNNPEYQNLSPGEISNVAQHTIENNTGVHDFVNSMFSNASIHPTDPRAFLVYIMLDEHFQVVPDLSGALQAENPDVLDQLAVTNLRINTNGFLYVYVNNASIRPVFFDNLFINHTSSLLLDKSDYYPFGMLWRLPSQNGDLENNYKYNGKELQKDLALYTEDYGARQYDPVVGRWLQVDPLAEKYRRWSPYNYGVDNPVRFIDPDGNGIGDVIVGTLIGVVTDIIPGSSNLRDVYKPDDNADYNDALQSTDATMGAIGSKMVETGLGTAAIGVGVLATAGEAELVSVGAASPVALPAVIIGAQVTIVGAEVTGIGAMLMANTSINASQSYNRGKKVGSSTKENTKVRDQKPGNIASDQVEGISRAKDFKGKQAPRGQKQNAINETSKSKQKEKTVWKNLKNIKDVKESYE
jgi:RHS repeat-associated protein